MHVPALGRSEQFKNALKSEKIKIFWMMVNTQGDISPKAQSKQYSNVWAGHTVHVI